MNSQKLLAALLFFLVTNLAFAQEKNTPVRLLIAGALELGGDPVATINFTNGDSQNVNAGQGISIGIGAEFAYKWIGLSYTSMNYTDDFQNRYSANAIGLTFSGVIPGRR